MKLIKEKLHSKINVLNLLISLIASCLVAFTCYKYLSWIKTRNWYEKNNLFLNWIEVLDHQLNDLKIRSHSKTEPDPNVVLVTIDDASIKEVGRWPWSRNLISQMTDNLFQYGVKSVGYDILFSEAETYHPENDLLLEKTLKKYPEKIVLGSFSSDLQLIKPYQDYCINEAFLITGGANLVKINTSFVVDDVGEKFDDSNWSVLFLPIFSKLKPRIENEFLKFHRKDNLSQLTLYQKNSLNSEILSSYFKYCQRWLTDRDEYFDINNESINSFYTRLFDEKKYYLNLDNTKRIEKFKAEIKEFPIWPYGEWLSNIKPFQESALYTGSIIIDLDKDGYIRKYPTFYRSGNRMGTSFIPSIALQTYLAGSGYRAVLNLINDSEKRKSIESLTIYDPSVEPEKLIQKLPIDHSGKLLINYYGPKNTINYVSAKDLLNDDTFITVAKNISNESSDLTELEIKKIDKNTFFKNKFVIIGVTAEAVYDMRNTPIDINFPGAEIQATALSNFIQNNFLKTFKNEEVYLPLLIIIFGVFTGLIISYFSAIKIALYLIALTTITITIDKIIFERFDIVYSSIFILLTSLVNFVFTGSIKYYYEERKKNDLKSTFSKYVSPSIVEDILLNVDNLKLGGRKQEVSVFFSDIRGFSTFSEKMDPQEISQLLTTYLTPMTEVIFNNKGTLDKYMGDGIIAFFGAPLDDENHAFNACRCALDSLKKLKLLQDEFKKNNLPYIDIGIGINTGIVSVGNMGSKIVQNYTVIGDSVNLGARLEAVNKDFGTRVLVSRFTYDKVKKMFIFRDIDFIRVKGKREPIQVFELLGELDDVNLKNAAQNFTDALNLYRNRDFANAKILFKKYLEDHPSDKPALLYVNRCEVLINSPPPFDWDGVYNIHNH